MKRKASSRISIEAEQTVLAALREGHREFLRFVTSRTASLADAEDVLQDFYLKVIRSMRSLRNPATLRVWLSQVLRRTLTDHYRRAAVTSRARQRLIETGDVSMRIEDDAELAVCRCLYRILPTLRSDQANLIWRVDLLGEPRKQVMRELGISANNLGVRIHRARGVLRAALERYCITCPTHGFLNCACDQARRTLSRRRRGGPRTNPIASNAAGRRRSPETAVQGGNIRSGPSLSGAGERQGAVPQKLLRS